MALHVPDEAFPIDVLHAIRRHGHNYEKRLTESVVPGGPRASMQRRVRDHPEKAIRRVAQTRGQPGRLRRMANRAGSDAWPAGQAQTRGQPGRLRRKANRTGPAA
ncbi:hypothetical protein GCM10023159_26680 [Brevibacterium yomogidense]